MEYLMARHLFIAGAFLLTIATAQAAPKEQNWPGGGGYSSGGFGGGSSAAQAGQMRFETDVRGRSERNLGGLQDRRGCTGRQTHSHSRPDC